MSTPGNCKFQQDLAFGLEHFGNLLPDRGWFLHIYGSVTITVSAKVFGWLVMPLVRGFDPEQHELEERPLPKHWPMISSHATDLADLLPHIRAFSLQPCRC